MTTSYYQTQSATIPQQFAAGVRVFQAHCWLGSGQSQVDGGAPLHLIAATPNGQIDTGRQLYDAVKVLTDEMRANHANEFCVLMLSDYSTGSTYGSWETFYKRVKVLSDLMAESGLLAENVDANTTINDVKGKVILKIQLNSAGKQYWGDLDGAKVLLNTYEGGGLNRSNTSISTPGAGNSVWYSQLTFGASSIADGGVNSSGSISSWPMSFIYTEQANPVTGSSGVNSIFTTALQNNITAYRTNYNNYKSDRKVFGMTYLGGSGNHNSGFLGAGAWTVTPTQVTESLIGTWNTSTQTGFDTTPYGWVMFNQVGGTNNTVNAAVAKVIDHNLRTLQKKTAPANYTGSAGATNGGQLND